MKGLLIVGCAILFFQNNAHGQLKTEFGLKGGLNLAGLSLTSAGKLLGVQYNNVSGLHAGGYALLRISKLGIQPELIFSKQGQRYNTPNDNNLRTNLSYINIPIMIKYYLLGGLNLQAGPQFGFLMSAKGDLVQSSTLGQPMLNQDIKKDLNSTDFSFAFGAGIDIPIGLNIAFRYNLGLGNVNKYKGGETYTPSFSTANTQNHVLQFSVGYRLYKLGK